MRGDVGTTGATWWKADRYELFKGTHIRPAPGAALRTYNVLEAYEKYWGGNGDAAPAYVALQNLDLDDDVAVLDWCGRFGLLGILHQRVVTVAFWPTWKPRLFGGLTELRPHQTILWEAEGPTNFPIHVVHTGSPKRPNDSELREQALSARLSRS